MKFLEKFNFTKDEIHAFEDNTADVMLHTLADARKLVLANGSYLIDLGVTNFKEIFQNYYELFLLDHSNFVNIFNKYDRDDLVEKLAKNVAIVEYL